MDGGGFAPSDYLRNLSQVVLTLGRHGKSVIVGRGAHLILEPAHTLRVRCYAPLEWRVEQIAQRERISLAGARARVTDKLGRTVELQGRAVGEFTMQPYGEGYFCTHGPMVFEGRGRLWRGMVEWSAMRTIPPWHLDKLGLDGGNDGGKGITDTPGGIKLQCEGHDVRYRNAWIKDLDLAKPDTDFSE